MTRIAAYASLPSDEDTMLLLLAGFLLAADVSHIPLATPVTALAISPDQQTLVVGSRLGVSRCTLDDPGSMEALSDSHESVNALAFSPDGETLAVGGGSPAEFGSIELLTWPNCEPMLTLKLHEDLVYSLAWSADSKTIATASFDHDCRLVDVEKRKTIATLTGHSRAATSCTFLTDATTLVSAGVDQNLRVWDVATATLTRSLNNHTAPVTALGVRPSAEGPEVVASAAEDRTVRFWQPAIGRMVRFARLASVPRCLVWHDGGTDVWVGCDDGRLRTIRYEDAKITAVVDVVGDRIISLTAGRNVLAVGSFSGLSLVPIQP